MSTIMTPAAAAVTTLRAYTALTERGGVILRGDWRAIPVVADSSEPGELIAALDDAADDLNLEWCGADLMRSADLDPS